MKFGSITNHRGKELRLWRLSKDKFSILSTGIDYLRLYPTKETLDKVIKSLQELREQL